MIARKVCDYYTRGRFEKRNQNFGYIYFATADKTLAYDVQKVFKKIDCDLMLVGRQELDQFLQKKYLDQKFDVPVYEEILSLIEQELISTSRIMMLSQESTFSQRIAAVSQTSKMFDVLDL